MTEPENESEAASSGLGERMRHDWTRRVRETTSPVPRGWSIVLFALAIALFVAAALQDSGGRQLIAGELAERRIARLAEPIKKSAAEFGLDPYLVAAVVFKESSGRLEAVSSSNALGLMQLKLATAGGEAERLGIVPPDEGELLGNAALNLRLGCSYLAHLLERQGGDLRQALMAYNAGPTAFNRWIRDAGGFEQWLAIQEAKGPAGPASVRTYAAKILEVREQYRELRVLG